MKIMGSKKTYSSIFEVYNEIKFSSGSTLSLSVDDVVYGKKIKKIINLNKF